MTNKELIQALAIMKGRLFSCPFSAEQMMAVSDCVHILDEVMRKLNENDTQKSVGAAT